LASGYRPGGPNSEAMAYGLPLTFGSDKTQNYEIGTKGDFIDHTFSFDASLYYISWKDIQLSLTNPYGDEYIANGSEAKSQGAELSVESKPVTGLTIGAWVAWNDSELTKAFPPTSAAYGVPGNRLPYSSRFSGSVSLEQDFPLTSRLTGFVGGALSYVGDREGIFTSPPPAIPPRQVFPAYAKTDLRAGAKYESWTVNFFVNNVADKRAVLSGGIGNAINPAAFQYIQPRLVGLNVVKAF
jgi:iron complex outermembrane recepter protein